MRQVGKPLRICLLGGVNEMVGNIVLLEDFKYGVKLFLDFGVNIKRFKRLYDEGEHLSSIEELITLDLIPSKKSLPINNLYTKQAGLYRQGLRDKDFPSNLDAIVISHPHKDHFLGVSFVNDN